MEKFALKKSDWPALDATDGGFIQSLSKFFLEGPPLSKCFLEALFQMKYKINPSGVSGESSPGLEVNNYEHFYVSLSVFSPCSSFLARTSRAEGRSLK